MAQPILTKIFSSPRAVNDDADKALMAGIQSQFPIENDHFRIELSNLRVQRKDYNHEDEKVAILQSKSLTYPIKGDVHMIDKATGKVVDEARDVAIADSFHLTDKHTIIYRGNNYVVSNQLQLRPGVYTRSQENGELESHFNTGKGRSFTITLDPQRGIFFITIGGSNTPLAPILSKVFGVSNAEVTKYIPAELWEANLAITKGKEDRILAGQYSRLVNRAVQQASPSPEEVVLQLREAFSNSTLDVNTTKITLGKEISHVSAEAFLLALRNISQVYRGERDEDNRDSLAFKRVQNLPDFLRTRFSKEHETVTKVASKVKFMMGRMDRSRPSLKGVLPSKPFNKVYSSYVLNSSLVSTPSETNPIESLENVGKVTVLGKDEGGISSDRAVPMSARNIDPSHLGILDPSRTPESGHAGIDLRFAMNAMRDKEGNLYTSVLDNAGKTCHLSVVEMVQTAVGFPHQEGKEYVQAQVAGKIKEVKRSEVKYWIPDGTSMYTVTTNLVPFLNSNHPGRLTMAGKAIPQALSLVDREAPLVQTVGPGIGGDKPFVETFGGIVSTISPCAGVVVSINSREIVIKGDDNTVHRVKLVKNLPFNQKGFQDDETPLVKVGETVKRDQVLFDNNYTRGGSLALGRNLNVAYLPYKGFNHEDGLVLSRGAADKLSSHHAYKFDYDFQESTVAKKVLLSRYFPGKFTPEQLANLDDAGFAKVGVTLHKGDPVIAVLERREPSPEDKLLGKLHKTLVSPYRLVLEEWDETSPATVVDAHTEGKEVRILVRAVKHLEVGDKLTGLHGNKGVCSLILEDHEMPYNKATGKPYDLLLNPASVTSRINLGQVLETVAGKIAQKKGSPYLIKNFSKENSLTSLKQELIDHGISDEDVVIDPKTGKAMPRVLAGPQYFLKLYKTTKDSYSARNVGGYDGNKQPVKGGDSGSKSVGMMELYGLLGSNARANIREMGTLKSEDNSAAWAKFLTGQPMPKPNTTLATNKFMAFMKGAGINVENKGGKLIATPLTDHDILMQSNGVIKEPTMIASKNLEAETGGLFDMVVTGGMKGTKWGHYALPEPIVNPVFEKPVRSILGLTQSEFDNIHSGAWGVKKIGDGRFHVIDQKSKSLVKELKL